jgi:anaerobic selenocysteine-containing dehydrogenase
MSAAEEKVTFCRICEAACGLVATVQDGQVTKLRPDPEHPLSSGYACPKGIAMLQVHDDPDRVTQPLKRTADGLTPVSWDEALDDIGARLKTVIAQHGAPSIGWYMGNPGAFSYSHPIWVKGFVDALGSQHYYTASSQDVSNRFAASQLLFGSPALIPIPDLNRTQHLLMIGANPLVSHGSLLTAPRIKDQLHAIVARGGRVIAVDPRRTETARAFEHVATQPDSDAWLLLAMLQVLFAEGLADRGALARQTTGAAWLEQAVAAFTPEQAAAETGIEADTIRALARDLAAADGGAVYGRTGSCLGRFGTLVAFLIDAVNAVAGQLDRPGGAVLGAPPISLDQLAAQIGAATYGAKHSRIGNFPDVLGAMPASLIAEEITTPGEGSLRALFVSAGNPVLSVPNGEAMADALSQLDLLVSLDFYVTETNRNADYVLPCTTFLEREDIPLALTAFFTTPFVQWTDAVVEPAGQARQEWEIIEAISARIGIVPSSSRAARMVGKLGLKLSPRRMMDLLLRVSTRNRLSVGALQRKPHGVVLSEQIPTGHLAKRVHHKDGRVHLDHPEIRAELGRLRTVGAGDPAFPLRLIGMRELRSHNSWMHNAPKLMSGKRVHAARLHPADGEALGLTDGDSVRVVSKDGAVELPLLLTDDMTPGVVAVPHGWGHHGGWQVANAAGGVNINALTGSAVEDLEPLAGMAFLNGIPVRLEAVAVSAESPRAAAAAAS